MENSFTRLYLMTLNSRGCRVDYSLTTEISNIENSGPAAQDFLGSNPTGPAKLPGTCVLSFDVLDVLMD